MRSQVITEWGKPLESLETPTPEPTGEEVLVRVEHCGVCHSDLHIHDGYFDLGGGAKLVVVLIPPGSFLMGEKDGKDNPLHPVEITKPFFLGKYEVTQEEWKKVTGLTPSWFSRTGGGKDLVQNIADAELNRLPVENVSWDDVQKFLELLNAGEQNAGWVYRLPLAAEWEYACRGGPLSEKRESAYDYYFDKPTNQLLPGQANSFSQALRRTCKVGSYKPNRLGLYDMHGNVWEWCNDPERTVDRTPLGGGWSSDPRSCTASFSRGPANWEGRVGCRVVRAIR